VTWRSKTGDERTLFIESAKPMVAKTGRTGEFLSCSAYPACRGTRSFRRGPKGEILLEEEVLSDEKCPDCGSYEVVPKLDRDGDYLCCQCARLGGFLGWVRIHR